MLLKPRMSSPLLSSAHRIAHVERILSALERRAASTLAAAGGGGGLAPCLPPRRATLVPQRSPPPPPPRRHGSSWNPFNPNSNWPSNPSSQSLALFSAPPPRHIRVRRLPGTPPVSFSPLWDERARVGGGGGFDSGDTDALLLDRGRGGKQSGGYLRCIVLDHKGTVRTNGKFRKTELCTLHGLNPRDLRKVDSRIPNIVPTILVRPQAFLVNILHVRALVKHDAVLIFEPHGGSQKELSRLQSVFVYNLEHNLKDTKSPLPYEFRALESILLSVSAALESEMSITSELVSDMLLDLEDDIEREKLKNLLHYSRKLSALQNRATLVHEAIDEVLKQDEDLAAMYLTAKSEGRPRQLHDHEELELLLESAAKQIEEIVNEAEALDSNVSSTQEIVELILDSNRNALLALDLKVSIATLGIGTGALFAGLFGMNLTSYLEETPYAFLSVSVAAGALSLFVTWLGLRRLARLRRMKLGMNSGGGGRVWDTGDLRIGSGRRRREGALLVRRLFEPGRGRSGWPMLS